MAELRPWLWLVLVAGCQGDVLNLGSEPPPLLTLEGRVNGAYGSLVRPRVGLLWAATPIYVPFCQERGPNPYDPDRVIERVASAGCRDPFDVVPAESGVTVPLDVETGRFRMVLDGLPDPDLMIGTLESRVAYASFVLFDDTDDDGVLDLHRGCGRGNSDRVPERIYASTFSTLAETQRRFVYLEGELDADSFFYPHPSCSTLPNPGFSLWQVGPLLPDAGDCALLPLDQPIELTVAPPGSLDVLSCGQRDNESFERPPMTRGSLADIVFECLDDGSIAVVEKECTCPGVRVAALRGCFDSLECTTPDWDLRERVPEWWPCEVPAGP
ncbi:MAG: hypothetical protein IPG45_29785 [Deltaproteobacteria bacterium]|nr:hypothetical protein [Deltaproteobacteria bacterium]